MENVDPHMLCVYTQTHTKTHTPTRVYSIVGEATLSLSTGPLSGSLLYNLPEAKQSLFFPTTN